MGRKHTHSITVGFSPTFYCSPTTPLLLYGLMTILSYIVTITSFYSAVWRTRCPCPCFVFLSGLSCTTYICIWLPFLPYAYYMWLPWFVSFLFLGFSPPESLPGDDVLCRLLPRPLPPVCFFFFFPTVFVPDLFWCNLLYLVTTAEFVADQLIM